MNDFVPHLYSTVCYIVAGVVIENDTLLMMQEAKPSCRGQWYLPAGRLESKETLIQGAQREVQEETGLVFEPFELLHMDSSYANWHRFTFIGRAEGSLKTQPDKESLTAAWIPITKVLNYSYDSNWSLRSLDIVPVVKRAVDYLNALKVSKCSDLFPLRESLSPLLPLKSSHHDLSFQLIFSLNHSDTVFTLTNADSSLPIISLRRAFHLDIIQFLSANLSNCKDLLASLVLNRFVICGLEHDGTRADGFYLALCIDSYCSVDNLPGMANAAYKWTANCDANVVKWLEGRRKAHPTAMPLLLLNK